MKDKTVIILEKNNQFASFAIDKLENKTLVGRFDSRCSPPYFQQLTDEFNDAQKILKTNLDISTKRGWNIVYKGQRNEG